MPNLDKKIKLLVSSEALPGRQEKMIVVNKHFVNHAPIKEPFPDSMEIAIFGLGCFWGAEKIFWKIDNIYSTAVGYSGGFTINPTYKELCTGMTGHSEVVRVIYNPEKISYESLLKIFWESHNPTQGMRQNNDIGTQYRSAIYTYEDKELAVAKKSEKKYQQALFEAGYGKITTEILPISEFYYAEDYHQQYLAKNPAGYCGLGGLGICY